MTSSSPKILITGGDGQLAQSIKSLTSSYNLMFYNRQQLDITQATLLKSTLWQVRPQFVIHTAAFTGVDLAEDEQQQAHLVNVKATEQLATYCAELNIPLLYISTDYVFDGEKRTPYSEIDNPNPLNFYGKTKLLGEQAVIDACQDYLILRISGVFSEFGRNIFKTFYHKMRQQPCHIVADQFASPTYAKHIADVILKMVAAYHKDHKQSGIYHFCSQEIVSWYDFACIIRDVMLQKNIACETIQPISREAYIAKAKRPIFSAFNCQKILATFNIEQPSIRKGIEETLSFCMEQT